MVILTGVQRNEQAITIIWIFFFAIMAFIAVFLITRISAIRKKRRIANEKAEQEYQTLKECYSHLTPEKIDDCADDQLPSAIILECQRKEEEDEDHYYESLNEVEKTVYGIYQLNQTIGGNSGIRSFFMSPALSDYVDDIENCFERVGAHDIASLLKELMSRVEAIESRFKEKEGLEKLDEDLGEIEKQQKQEEDNHEEENTVPPEQFAKEKETVGDCSPLRKVVKDIKPLIAKVKDEKLKAEMDKIITDSIRKNFKVTGRPVQRKTTAYDGFAINTPMKDLKNTFVERCAEQFENYKKEYK